MKNYLPLLILSSVLLSSCQNTSSVETAPVTAPPQHLEFKLYDGLSDNITAPITEMVNNNYERILNDLEVESLPKVTVEIWNDETHFQNDMKKDLGINYPGAAGYVYNMQTVRVLNRGNISKTVLHEFAHVVSLYVQNRIANNPRWLWEAVALFESQDFIHPKNISYLAAGNFPTLNELNTDFNSGNQKIYAVGFLLPEYIIATWGKTKYVQLIRMLGSIENVLEISRAQFESGWKEFVTAKYLSNG